MAKSRSIKSSMMGRAVNDMDRWLNRTVLLLCLSLLVIYAIDEVMALRSISNLNEHDESLVGRPFCDLFSRTPILPDRFVFDSSQPEVIDLEYDGGWYKLKKLSGMRVSCAREVVVDTCRIGTE